MKSCSPISAFESPRAIRRNTSISREVSSSSSFGGAGRASLANCPITRWVIEGGEEGVPGGHRPDRRYELFGRLVLQDEAAGAGAECLVDVLVEVEGGEDQDPGLVVCREDPPGGLKPVELRHPYVHQHDVGLKTRGLMNGLAAGAGLGHHIDVPLAGEQHPEARPHHRLIVGHEDADAHRRGSR